MKKIVLFASLAILASCNSGTSSEFDYCQYATKKPDYSFFQSGDVIEKCTVADPKTKNSEEAGYKSVSHTATLELSIKNSAGEIRTNKRWLQIMGSGSDDLVVVQNKSMQ